MYTIGYLKGQITDIKRENTEHIINVLLNGIKN